MGAGALMDAPLGAEEACSLVDGSELLRASRRRRERAARSSLIKDSHPELVPGITGAGPGAPAGLTWGGSGPAGVRKRAESGWAALRGLVALPGKGFGFRSEESGRSGGL